MKSSLFHNVAEGAQKQGHDSKVRLCRVVSGHNPNLVVFLEDWRVIEDARGHADQVAILIPSLGAVAVDGLAPADELTGGVIEQRDVQAAHVKVPENSAAGKGRTNQVRINPSGERREEGGGSRRRRESRDRGASV